MRITAAAKDATRKRILSVAQRQFAQHGFDATTTRDIAAAANIAAGTLFNYFPTKESIVDQLVGDACQRAGEKFLVDAPAITAELEDASSRADRAVSLEEDLFAYVAAILRALKPLRKHLPAVLETSLSPLANDDENSSLRMAHLETVAEILSRHGQQAAVTPISLQLYWTVYTGLLAFWSRDKSPRQEDTLALLDESLAMFAGWFTHQSQSETEGIEASTTRQIKRER